MPDTRLIPPDELDIIRKDAEFADYTDALLAHIDALTAAVEALPEPTLGKKGGVERAAVLAILRGEQ